MTNYKPGEVRVTSATGGQKGQKNIRIGGADPIAMLELGRVYGIGEMKYDRYNYLLGYNWSLSIDALNRHLLAFQAGEEYDECTVHPGVHDDEHLDVFDPKVCDGSGLLHTAHVAWHGLALTSFQLRGLGTDDRFKAPPAPYWPRGSEPLKPVRQPVVVLGPGTRFLCGHEWGEEPILTMPGNCGTEVHWSKYEGIPR